MFGDVYCGMVVQVFFVVDGCMFDFVDGGVDFVDVQIFMYIDVGVVWLVVYQLVC